MPLDQVLSLLSARAKTSTAHDQLYAFFGMNQNEKIRLLPSYQAPIQDALVATARSIIEGTKSLDIFETLPRKMTTNAVPSWVPDFTAPRLTIPFAPSAAYTWTSNTRPGIYPWQGRCHVGTLWVHGKVIDAVYKCVVLHIGRVDIHSDYSILRKGIKTWTRSRHYDPDVSLPALSTMLPVLLAEGHCEPSTYDPDAISRLQSRIRDGNSSKGLVNISMQQKPHTERLYYDSFTFKSKDLAELEHRIDHDCRFVGKLDLHYPAQRYA
jgi:hypothetical protein